MKEQLKIGIVGSGNVAFQLTKALITGGIQPHLCFARNPISGNEFSQTYGIPLVPSVHALNGLDLIFACVSDDALEDLLPTLSELCPVVSTSGTVDVLSLKHQHALGVFYPLQSFTKNKTEDFSKVPIFIEASSAVLNETLSEIAHKLSQTVVQMDATQRKKLHIAAVFINNFTNHLLDLMQDFSSENQLDFQWFAPLLDETIRKGLEGQAFMMQTGPAKRNDQATIQAHEAQLEEPLLSIYRTMTTSIQQRFQTND
jgi:predicted short-subunit dehydrogenase-like oxidoreductase (DUF2520 family)